MPKKDIGGVSDAEVIVSIAVGFSGLMFVAFGWIAPLVLVAKGRRKAAVLTASGWVAAVTAFGRMKIDV